MSTVTELSDRWRHDLKNQLGIILGFSELLLYELDPASSMRPDLQEIHDAAQRAIQLLAAIPPWPPSEE